MLGKASEINIAEVELRSLNQWIYENQSVTIMDIKYAFHPEGDAWALIIYKEASQ
jgi:hypothetical protein